VFWRTHPPSLATRNFQGGRLEGAVTRMSLLLLVKIAFHPCTCYHASLGATGLQCVRTLTNHLGVSINPVAELQPATYPIPQFQHTVCAGYGTDAVCVQCSPDPRAEHWDGRRVFVYTSAYTFDSRGFLFLHILLCLTFSMIVLHQQRNPFLAGIKEHEWKNTSVGDSSFWMSLPIGNCSSGVTVAKPIHKMCIVIIFMVKRHVCSYFLLHTYSRTNLLVCLLSHVLLAMFVITWIWTRLSAFPITHLYSLSKPYDRSDSEIPLELEPTLLTLCSGTLCMEKITV